MWRNCEAWVVIRTQTPLRRTVRGSRRGGWIGKRLHERLLMLLDVGVVGHAIVFIVVVIDIDRVNCAVIGDESLEYCRAVVVVVIIVVVGRDLRGSHEKVMVKTTGCDGWGRCGPRRCGIVDIDTCIGTCIGTCTGTGIDTEARQHRHAAPLRGGLRGGERGGERGGQTLFSAKCGERDPTWHISPSVIYSTSNEEDEDRRLRNFQEGGYRVGYLRGI